MLEITVDEYLKVVKGKSKYGAKKTRCSHNQLHDSKREATRCDELYVLKKAGVISGLKQQPRFVLQRAYEYEGKKIRALCYFADFAYWQDGVRVIEDCKGYRTGVYKIKKKLLLPILKRWGYHFVET